MQGLPAQYFFNILLALASQGFANFHGVVLHLVVVILLRALFCFLLMWDFLRVLVGRERGFCVSFRIVAGGSRFR